MRDVGLDRSGRRGRRLVLPQQPYEPVHPNDVPRLQHQDGKQRTLPRPTGVDLAAVALHPQSAQHTETQPAASRHSGHRSRAHHLVLHAASNCGLAWTGLDCAYRPKREPEH